MIENLINEITEKYPTKTIWLYTGSTWKEIADLPLVKNLDVVVDGEFVLEQRDVTLMWKGSSNQRVIDVQASLKKGDVDNPVLHCNNYYKG